MHVILRPRTTLSSTWLVRALARSGDGFSCKSCGSRMFVETRDGQCPVCRSCHATRDDQIADIVEEQSREAASDWL